MCYLVITYNGKGSENIYIYIYIYKKLEVCYTLEINRTL